ncbi:P-loop containing nucleoside triphosphate hydrolase protein [Atractiella rhizophila]|nr:P-loop containing nucleoside triphosphate hydrolase protein [Atractiella rhizophila]
MTGNWKGSQEFYAGSEYNIWTNFTSAPRSDAHVQLYHQLRSLHPNHALVVTNDYRFNLFAYASAPDSQLAIRFLPAPPLSSNLIRKVYAPSGKRSEGPGVVLSDVMFGAFEVHWAGEEFVAYLYQWEEGYISYLEWFIFHPSLDRGEEVIDTLILSVGKWASELHKEIMVFDMGWMKDAELWNDVQSAEWTDVILDEELKQTVREDVEGFFRKGKVYRRLGVPYKRGVIFLGPPGNGKTISIKALMKSASQLDPPIPSLYVKSFRYWSGDEGGIQAVFEMARMQAPCLLILEDLDSLISDSARSFFLNQLDGLASNDGVLIIGTTNHFDRLDDALKNRPSRFDRKYNFPDPPLKERRAYARYWQHKLEGEKSTPFPDSLIYRFAKHTDGFSFAYMKEAFLSTLLYLAGLDNPAPEKFEQTLMKQVGELRKELERGGEIQAPFVDEWTAI